VSGRNANATANVKNASSIIRHIRNMLCPIAKEKLLRQRKKLPGPWNELPEPRKDPPIGREKRTKIRANEIIVCFCIHNINNFLIFLLKLKRQYAIIKFVPLVE
jgi:hypothetical protein